MISVAVCDENVGFLYDFSNTVLNIMGDDLETMDQFSSSEMLIESKKKYELIFSDIDTFASHRNDIEKYYKDSLFVFLTDKDSCFYDMVNMTYAFGGIRKNMVTEDLHAVVKKYYRSEQQNKFLPLTINRQIFNVRFSDIVYIERTNNYINIHTNKETYSERSALSKLSEILGKHGFSRTHAGYIVNLDHVSYINSNAAVLFSGKEIPISRRKLRSVKQTFRKRCEVMRK